MVHLHAESSSQILTPILQNLFKEVPIILSKSEVKSIIKDSISHTVTDDLKPTVRTAIEIDFFNTDERGTFYLARNPRNQRYIKLHEKGVFFLKKLDGTKSISELQKEFPDINVKNFVTILAKDGFLEGIKSKKKKEPFYTIKVPLFKSNSKPLINLYKRLYWMGSTPFKIFYSCFVISGFILFILNSKEIFHYTVLAFDLTMPLLPLILIFVIYHLVEFAHEFAHTGASYYYGAEPGDIGLVSHFLVVFFYVETPDTRKLSNRENLVTFLIGPLTSLFAAEVCTYLFVLTDSMPFVWGGSAFFWHMSCVITLAPFMQTDGYYIVQHTLKFPNLFQHAVKYVWLNLGRLVRRIPEKEYTEHVKGYTRKELKIMKIFSIFMPVQIGILVFFFFFMAVKIDMFNVFQLAPVILFSDHLYGLKGYVLLVVYSVGLAKAILIVAFTTYKFFKRGEVD